MKYLSAEWFDAFSNAVSSVEPSAEPQTPVGIGQVVTDAPNGDVHYTLIVGGNKAPSVIVGSIDRASVTIVADYETAAAIAKGTSTAELLYEGRLKVRGDVEALLKTQDALSKFGDVLFALSATTEF